jgi:uncharacterized surface protein with fasciclin (FAS1) repeats
MTVHRTALCVASFAAISALAMSACSSNVTDAEPSSSSSGPVSTSPNPTTTTAEEPTTSTAVDVPAGVAGPGCADYMTKVPSGPGSLLGMAVDPVAVAISNSPQLTTFAGALSGKLNPEVDLTETLNKGQYTIFAPTDDAFARLDPALLDKFKSDSVALISVLQYHVLPGELDPSAVVGEHKTLQGQSLTVSSSGDDLRVNNAGVACGGIKTANATVYLVDALLSPPPPAPPTPTSGAPSSGATDTSTVSSTPTS